MIVLLENTGMTRASKVAEFATFEDAKAHVEATYKIVDFELDADHADCADFITESLGLYSIQPADLKVN